MQDRQSETGEIGGPKGPEPTRFGKCWAASTCSLMGDIQPQRTFVICHPLVKVGGKGVENRFVEGGR